MEKRGDVEMGALYPNMMENPQMRWAFIRKVYMIVTLQILITIAVSSVVIFYRPIPEFLLSRTFPSLAAMIAIIILPFLVMVPLIFLRQKHPWNMILLFLFTISLSMAIGLACATRSGKVILEAAALTAIVVGGLTLYTFWAAKRGHDFSFLGPFLSVSLLVLIIFGIVQVFFPFGAIGTSIYGCIGAIIFAGFIIYDTDNLIKRHSYDEYICAAISLYLDVVNLFLYIMTALGSSDS
ncbi:BI1-like protein [Apostasia shenzhenica]|uniref:BI1-like protein n=1 Tax=Apostasia shenzhenica TaxID=1088818 RepID=A0A2I0BB18_9ASPA|nr:BI1-like protein [Apostasia shenzhenica]